MSETVKRLRRTVLTDAIDSYTAYLRMRVVTEAERELATMLCDEAKAMLRELDMETGQ